jgi:hypothetical protein
MIRCALLIPLIACTPARAMAIVPPVPRVVIPQDAIPRPQEPDDSEVSDDPAKVAERIAKNARDLGDRLAKEDTGPDTLTGQEQLKRDIESLIKALENPPPMSNQSDPMNNQQGNQGGQNRPMGGGQSSSAPMGGQRQPRGGEQTGRQPGNRSSQQQPPTGSGQQAGRPMQADGQPQDTQPNQQGQADPSENNLMGGSQPGGGGVSKPALPLDEAIARDFWGNLPDLPRQRMLQFFREQYMSRYKELLPQYYQSLAEKEKMNKK